MKQEQHHMSKNNLIDVDNKVEEEVEYEKMDDDQTVENPEVVDKFGQTWVA